ncbi:hypothetical protein THERMOT_2153 [Bathymodiolus thermophilus thioautotrophic gill symbiont]|nr:hypothetical protein THERMOT_2153 [Bathymodiolus thermophilus thioautotrophic gill symbiont]
MIQFCTLNISNKPVMSIVKEAIHCVLENQKVYRRFNKRFSRGA